MIDIKDVREIALSFLNCEEKPHFDSTSFRVNKKIFASVEIDKNRACLKFSLNDQETLCLIDKSLIYAVDNYWGKFGWTYIDLNNIKKKQFKDLILSAYNEVLNNTKK
jgi:predicted DNA-binding protein (MmcQ/YjbR family)